LHAKAQGRRSVRNTVRKQSKNLPADRHLARSQRKLRRFQSAISSTIMCEADGTSSRLGGYKTQRPEALESDTRCTRALRRFLFLIRPSSPARTTDCINIEVERVDD